MTSFPIQKVRREFPILSMMVNNHPLIYFDNAASTQKPAQVIDAIRNYYETENCNIHRGFHYLSIRATEAFEGTRCEIK
jgi:cysteine desulfurase / selenocysteine lyase